MWFLTEDGLYEVLMQNRKPIVKEFKKEVKNSLLTESREPLNSTTGIYKQILNIYIGEGLKSMDQLRNLLSDLTVDLTTDELATVMENAIKMLKVATTESSVITTDKTLKILA